MFKIPQQTLEYWKLDGPEPFSEADISEIETAVGFPLPNAYREFALQYGSVQYDTLDVDCAFKYEYREDGASMEFDGAISHFLRADRVVQYFHGLTRDDGGDDLPKFPPIFLPIGMDYGQGNILLELGGEKERIFYWEFQYDSWGKGNNVRLGFVAENLYDFVNNLEEFVDPDDDE